MIVLVALTTIATSSIAGSNPSVRCTSTPSKGGCSTGALALRGYSDLIVAANVNQSKLPGARKTSADFLVKDTNGKIWWKKTGVTEWVHSGTVVIDNKPSFGKYTGVVSNHKGSSSASIIVVEKF